MIFVFYFYITKVCLECPLGFNSTLLEKTSDIISCDPLCDYDNILLDNINPLSYLDCQSINFKIKNNLYF